MGFPIAPRPINPILDVIIFSPIEPPHSTEKGEKDKGERIRDKSNPEFSSFIPYPLEQLHQNVS
jgi:hypothetical protein